MTLDEAIKHCKEVAKQQEVKANELYKAKDFEESRDCIWCSKEHEQLAEWLKELKKFREQQPYEKFESTKDHIYKLAGDYKCWDNRLTEDEAVELCHILEQETCEDAISRAEALKAINKMDIPEDMSVFEIKSHIGVEIGTLPPVQPMPKMGHCKDCKYFEYDHFENMGGIPLITAHKVCKRHGLICKTDEDGYCHLWEHKAESEDKE